MRRPNPELTERLAGEYVLGTLRGAARARFVRWIAAYDDVALAVRRWEDRLAGLSASVTPVAPPPHIWNAIARRTAAPPAPRRAAARWRGWALAASVALVAVGAWLMVGKSFRGSAWQPAAELRAESNAYITWRLEFDATKRELRASAERPLPTPPSGAHELWALAPDKAPPVSLGVLPAAGRRTFRLSPTQLAALSAARQLAVSEEPPGGSPTGLPTGRVVLIAPRDALKFSS